MPALPPTTESHTLAIPDSWPIPMARRVRAATRMAVLWGIAWTGLPFAILGTMVATGAAPAGAGLLDALALSVRFGVWGGICGAAFSVGLGVLLRGRLLQRLRPTRVALVGAAGLGLFVPLLMQVFNVISGDGPVAWPLVLDDGLRAAVLGGVTAGLMVKLAQRGAQRDG